MTSSDGANFEEAKCWQPSTRSEAAFEQTFMFDAPRNVKAVTMAMRSPQSWGYFGINSAVVIAEPGPLMLVRWALSFIDSGLWIEHTFLFCYFKAALHPQLVNNALLQVQVVLVLSLVWRQLRQVMGGR